MRFIIIIMSSAILLISNSECRGQGPLVVITDLDNSGGPFVCSSETCTWTSGEFSIAGASEYVLSADIECIGIDLFEEDDYLTISYRIDNGSWIPLMELYDDFRRTTFTTSVTGSGLSMQLKIDSETSSSTETFVVHKLMVETAAGSTFPSFPPDTGIDPECGMQASAGTLIIDGGSLERVPTHPTIMAMIEHMGGLETHIVASYQGQSEVTPAEYAEYTGYWVDIGFETVSTMTSDEHDMVESNTEAFVADLKLATGLFMRGGRQWRIVDTFGNADVSTLTLDEMWNLLERGGVIGGTSAGATVQGDFMPRGDTGGSGTMISEEPLHQQGFRFLPNVAFDVHVSARGRITDLKEVMEYTNARDDDIIGIGIDEDTAIVVQGKVFEVIGSGVVYVHTWNESVEGGYILILRAGDKYNLCTRQEFVAGNSWGYLKVINNLNSRSRYVNVVRDDEFYPGATDGYNNSLDIDRGSQSPGYPDAFSVIPGYELWSDYRLNDSNAPYNVNLAFIGNLSSTQLNWLEFEFYEVDGNDGKFGKKQIVFGSKRIPYGPAADIKRGLKHSPDPNKLRLDLIDVPAGTPGVYDPNATLDIGTRLLADLNGDKIVNFLDYALFARDWRNNSKEKSIGNISGPNGIPDGNDGGKAIINEIDLGAFAEQWLCDPNTISKAMQSLPKELYERLNQTASYILNNIGDSKLVCNFYQTHINQYLSPDITEKIVATKEDTETQTPTLRIMLVLSENNHNGHLNKPYETIDHKLHNNNHRSL